MTTICSTCACWRHPDAEGAGECWSMDRLDNDASKGPAGYSYGYQTCEAWFPIQIQHKRLPEGAR
jgi:hypothetical protein